MTTVTSPRGRLLTAGQAADYLGIGVDHVRRIIERQEITVLRTPGGRLMGIYERDCDAWRDARTAAATASAKLTEPRRAHDVDREMDAIIGSDRRF